MSMTQEEKIAKKYLTRVLQTDGYPTYAKIFDKFEFNFTNDPRVIAYLDPERGIIVANRGLDEFQICVIIRHEILHDYLKHEKRLLDKLAKEHDLNPDDLDDIAIKNLKNELYGNTDFNIAADYEISNRGYTEKDKKTVRNIILNGRTLSGLVTEDDHPEWTELSVEEMFDEIRKERANIKPDDDVINGVMVSEIDPAAAHLAQQLGCDVFVGIDGTVYSSPEVIEGLKQTQGRQGL